MSSSKVLDDELDNIVEKRRAHRAVIDGGAGKTDPSEVRASLAGIAFSGGGIRSATFCLGILQSLCSFGLLKRFDYLSTVSGGGYIGSWLTALMQRGHVSKLAGVPENGNRDRLAVEAINELEESLKPDVSWREGKSDHHAIQFLRNHSNYLTPKAGLTTADTWSAIATYLRNLMLNLVSIIGALTLLLLIPRVFARNIQPPGAQANFFTPFIENLGFFLLAVTGALFVLATYVFARNIRSLRCGIPELATKQKWLLYLLVSPLFLSAFLASYWMPEAVETTQEWLPAAIMNALTFDGLENNVTEVFWCLTCALIYTLIWIIASIKWGADAQERSAARINYPNLLRIIGTSIVAGLVGGYLLVLISNSLRDDVIWRAIYGPAFYLGWLYLLLIFHMGLMSRRLDDSIREWLSRVGAWLLIFAAVWITVSWLALRGPYFVDQLSSWAAAGLLVTWITGTLGGLLASRSSKSASTEVSRFRTLLLSATPYLFLAGLLLLLSAGIHKGLLNLVHDTPPKLDALTTEFCNSDASLVDSYACSRKNYIIALQTEDEALLPLEQQQLVNDAKDQTKRDYLALVKNLHGKHLDTVFAVIAVASIVVFFALLLVDINEFSMHWLYRNRLIRAYLGASVPEEIRTQRRQRFTGFYREDDIDLKANGDGNGITLEAQGPYHLINAAINLVGGKQLAWQERKAASFLFSPLFCGYTPFSGKPGYRYTKEYATGFNDNSSPLTLGAAVAVSGAAASPNMGFRTSTAFAFLMSVFNVRLGRWIGNPRNEKTYKESGPRFAGGSMVQELFGSANGKRRHVYVSDGGHFENLGIYELVRRRCRYIISCDAGADPTFSFEDLGNAIRKCRTDFGVEIEIDVSPIRERNSDNKSEWHCAVGHICYPDEDVADGTLVYIKTSLTGNEPEDVLNYAKDNDSFPHQTTSDQFFDESQFESYRRLGIHVGETVFGRSAANADPLDPFNNERLFQSLMEEWYPPVTIDQTRFTELAGTLDILFERLRTSDALNPLGAQFYPEWQSLIPDEHLKTPLVLPETDEQKREAFYFCNSLIQLMENAYIELDLEAEYDHPDNRGWMNLFRHWSWSGMFRATWAISACTYGRRFQTFCEHHLKLTLGKVCVECCEVSKLNVVEREQVGDYQLLTGFTDDELVIYQIRTELQAKALDEQFGFPVGYAVCIRNSSEITLFRIQDHLRKMGLGRQGLKALIQHRQDNHEQSFDATDPVSELVNHAAETDFAEIRKVSSQETSKVQMRSAVEESSSVHESKTKVRDYLKSLEEFDRTNSRTFGALYRSVCRELRIQARRAPAPDHESIKAAEKEF